MPKEERLEYRSQSVGYNSVRNGVQGSDTGGGSHVGESMMGYIYNHNSDVGAPPGSWSNEKMASTREGQKSLPQNTFHHMKIVYDSPESIASLQRGIKFFEEFEQSFKDRLKDVLELSQTCTTGLCPYCQQMSVSEEVTGSCSWMYARYAWTGSPSALKISVHGWGGIPLGVGTGNWASVGSPPGLQQGASNVYEFEYTPSSTSRCGSSETFSMCKDFITMEISELLGCGAFGKVYRARVNGIERAVKFLSVEVHGLERVLREAEIGCFLQHPNIVRTFAYRLCDIDQGYIDAMSAGRLLVDPDFSASKRNRAKFGLQNPDMAGVHTERIIQVQIIQELCDVGPLSRYIHSSTFFEGISSKSSGIVTKLECIILIALDIINALIHLGYNGVIHGDLSSDNVLLKEDMTSPVGLRAKVVDFGRSRVEKGRSVRTNSLGTVMYMPPEMLLDGNLNKTSDLYSLGVIITEMWTNTPAWKEKQSVQILFAMSAGKRIEIPCDLPDAMKLFITKCLSDDSTERPTTEMAFQMLKDMVDPKVLSAHLVATCVASRLDAMPKPQNGMHGTNRP